MVIRELSAEIAGILKENAVFEAQQIVMSAAGMNNTDFVFKGNHEVSSETARKAYEMAKRRISGEPLQYILGTAEFMGLEFKVNENVLIPRADTETLVEDVINLIAQKKVSVLDIGTGSGCIGISIAHFCKNAEITFLDISEKALDVAKENAVKNGVSGEFICMDILKDFPRKSFDVIVSNPPYIRADVVETLDNTVKDYEPYNALCGGKDGLIFYRRITALASELLKDNGILSFEIGYDQGRDVSELVSGFNDVRLIKDLCGNDRVVTGFKKG